MTYREERGEEKISTLNKVEEHPGKLIIETPELEGWIRGNISEIMFIVSVMFACVEQLASVPSQKDPPVWNLN